MNLSVDLASSRVDVELRSPLIGASGTVGSVIELAQVAPLSPYGAAVAKSVAPVAWQGRPPTYGADWRLDAQQHWHPEPRG